MTPRKYVVKKKIDLSSLFFWYLKAHLKKNDVLENSGGCFFF